MQKYVLGYAFSEDRSIVSLVEKLKGPLCNLNKWNGIGGKVETCEEYIDAMVREFHEETGILIGKDDWRFVGTSAGKDFFMEIFSTITPLADNYMPLQNDVGEPLKRHTVSAILENCYPYGENVQTIVQHILTGTGEVHFSV